MANVNMQVNLGGLIMRNPVTVASGTFAAGREYNDFVPVERLGAVTTKGVSLNGWTGNDSPVLRKPHRVCSIPSACRIPALRCFAKRICHGWKSMTSL